MHALALLALATCASARNFNITDLLIPPVVYPTQSEVDVECRYDANFTLLNWFKGPNEFFRYKPGAAPSTRSFPILGVGKMDLVNCGPTACRLKLGGLTEEASGKYRCDIEKDIPPYRFDSRVAYMEVRGHEHKRPQLEGLSQEYSEDDHLEAYCRGEPGSELRWYVNGREIQDHRGSPHLQLKSSRLMFQGIPPTVTVQCAEFKYGNLSGSKEVKARWKDLSKDERPQEQRFNSAGRLEVSVGLLVGAFVSRPRGLL